MSARPKSVLIALRPAEVETLRAAFHAYLYLIEIDPDSAGDARKAKRLMGRLTRAAETAFHVRYARGERRTP